MNNLLKIFLIFNLFSATTSAVNNFTLELPEVELAMGQNSSQIDEGGWGRKLYFPYLHGGMRVTGLSWVGNLPNQRDCTLSFPVYRTEDKTLGFLTSYLCASDVIFVDGDETGSMDQPHNLLSDPGLDYVFVVPISDYWLDEVSRKIDYSRCTHFGRGIVDIDKPLPIIPTPSQPLSVGDKVYAHGGNSGMVQGVILETGVKISVWNPKSEDPFYLYDVVKVKMNKVYSDGNLGAPVYIPLSVPDSDQLVASPVGQVVEIRDWDLKTKGQDIWYYIPIDRILEDSKLIIASGDLSYLLPPNNTDSSNDSLSDDLVSEANDSDTNPVRRQPDQPQAVDAHAGFRMWNFRFNALFPISGDNAKRCTLGFAVRKVLGRNQFDHGFLTLGGCMHGDLLGFPNARNSAFYTPSQNWVREQAAPLGNVASLKHDPANGLSYVILRLRPNDAQYTLWNDNVSAEMPVENGGELEFVRVSNQPQPQTWLYENQELCWWGSASSHMCGTVIDTSVTRIKANPWKWPVYLKAVINFEIHGIPMPPIFLQHDPKDYFEGLIKVRVDENYQPHAEEGHQSDSGAPVYLPSLNRLGLITAARPVGILFDYVLEFEAIDDMCLPVWYMYCLSVDRILRDSRSTLDDLELIGENFA